MYHQATEESAVAFKKLHETVNAILQMEDDELDVISNHIFLATLVDNSRLIFSRHNNLLEQNWTKIQMF